MSNPTHLILASGSPRRADLLAAAGIPVDIIAANVDERARDAETPEVYVRRIAEAKARAVSERAAGRLVLAADTIVVVDEQALGKPSDSGDAARMLGMLSGRRHEVMSGVSLMRDGRPVLATRVEVTAVEFAALSQQEIDWYIATRESNDKAGGYAIQGFASRFVTRIDGSYSNVVGLPMALVYRMCREVGLLLS